MQGYYTSVCRFGNQILYMGYDEKGKRVKYKEEFQPTLFTSSQALSEWKDIYGNPVEPVMPGTMRDCKDFIDRYSDVVGFTVYGNKNYVAQFLHAKFPEEIEWKTPKFIYWDIETLPTEYGYSEAHEAEGQISAIAFVDNDGNAYSFSFVDYEPKSSLLQGLSVEKHVFNNERDMLMGAINFLVSYDPSIYTGWNSVEYDMVYFLTRIIKILGEDTAKRISPWGKIQLREREEQGKMRYQYEIYGVEQLDYMHLFKKFGMKFGPQESYKLDAIAELVLNKKKLDYSMYKNLKEMYEKDFQRYMEYNIIDTRLVYELEQELGYINMCLTAAYSAKVNYSEELLTIPAWDSIIYGELLKRKICVPLGSDSTKRPYPGGYQKDLIKGYHKYVFTEDVASLYPSTIIQFNISPETICGFIDGVTISPQPDVYELSDKTDYELSEDQCVSAAGHVYRTDKQGIIPELLQRFIDSRKVYKKQMKAIENEMENIKAILAQRGVHV
jgi:DNA polymerase elongation subunit (family B)